MFAFNCITIAALLIPLLLSTSIAKADSPPPPLPFIQTHGTQFVDEQGKPVTLKGCNLGNWLLIEMWMFGGCLQAPDQAHLFAKLDERFGSDQAAHLLDVYRSSWITPRDFEMIRSFGFNVVRLPIDYRLLQGDEAPYAITADAFKWIDRAVDMAEASGIYIILDLHSAPGGQSNDQCTGQIGTNKLWNNPINHQRTVDIWKAMATRYRNRSNVAAYDLMNEPYADHKMDIHGELKSIMADCYSAIRETGDKHVVFFPGSLGKSPDFYGDPHETGWTNVAFTEHFYPGLFGDKTAFESHILTLTKTIPARQKWLDRIQSPYYIGEFNPVLDSIGGARITRAYYDTFAQHGWAGTLWSFKLIKPAGGASSNTWYCVSNADSLPKLNLDSASNDEIERFFASLATVALAPNPPLLKALTSSEPANLPIAAPQATVPTKASNSVAPAGWSNVEIGSTTPGAVSIATDGTLTINAGGGDVFGHSDAFRFISKSIDGNGELAARVTSLLESDLYAKAGVMARWGDDPAAAFAMANVFPDGSLAFISRSHPGEEAKEIKSGSGSFPVDLRVTVKDGQVAGSYRRPGGNWTDIGSMTIQTTPACRMGLAVDSHNDDSDTQAVIRLIDSETPPAPIVTPIETSLLKNGSFEDDGTWTLAGTGFKREANATPAHSGTAVMSYHAATGPGHRASEISQDVPAVAGKRYHFSIYALRENAGAATKIELQLQGNLDGHEVTLNSNTLAASTLGTGNQWTQLTLDGTALSDTIRVRIIVTPSPGQNEVIQFDDAMLTIRPG